MFCVKCGAKMAEGARFCGKCGNPAASPGDSGSAAGPETGSTGNGSVTEQAKASPDVPGKKKPGRVPLAAAFVLILAAGLGVFGYQALHREDADTREETEEEDIPPEAEEQPGEEEPAEAEEQPGEEEPAETEEPSEETAELVAALDNLSYYGDKSRCAMSSEQAAAYMRLIADGLAGDFSFRGGYDENHYEITSWDKPFRVMDFDLGEQVEVDRSHVMLCDFAGDGVPYLYVCSSTDSIDDQSFEIYGWADQTVKLVYDTDAEKSFRNSFSFYEEESGLQGIRMNEVAYRPPTMFYGVRTYAFAKGTINTVCERTEEKDLEEDVWHVIENGEETIYTEEEYSALTAERHQTKEHEHSLPYACFHEMQPGTLSEMRDGLKQYAALLGWEEQEEEENAAAMVLEQYREFLQGNLTAEYEGNPVLYSEESTGEDGSEPSIITLALTDIDGDGLPELQIKEIGNPIMDEGNSIYTVYPENGGLKIVESAAGGSSDLYTLYTNGLLWMHHGMHLPVVDGFVSLQGEKLACFVNYENFVDMETWEATAEAERRQWQEEGYEKVYVTYDGDTGAAEFTPETFAAEYGREEVMFYDREEFLNMLSASAASAKPESAGAP